MNPEPPLEPVLPVEGSYEDLVRSNWPDTYDLIFLEDPTLVEQALDIVESALWPEGDAPDSTTASPALVKYVANQATLLMIPAARDYYASRKVLSEKLHEDTRTNYDWGKVLDRIAADLININAVLWPLIQLELSNAGSAYPETTTEELINDPTLFAKYHVSPEPIYYSQGLFNDF